MTGSFDTVKMRLVTLLALTGALFAGASERVDFTDDVRPILSDRCFHCHGPDDANRAAKLRLDTEEGALAVLVRGNPGDSELIHRISTKDADDLMPPPDSNRSLSQAEIETLTRWVEQGAPWKKHWSFIPLSDVPEPAVKNDSWPINGIDRFVLSRLESKGLQPEPEASRERLLRRVSLDLTGLPPTLEEIDAFLLDNSPNAYEKVVDRLLSSSAYGEKMARDWLDVARFADTYGYQADRFNHLWPWRDWVINAFNDNLPYDDFITWQTAGDLLPNAGREQIIATAFNRNHRQTNEGGSINEEYRVEYNADRVKTLGLAFLGLTLECSRCHDHKYDPILQKDFYSLFAFFNSTDESGLYSHFTDAIPNPTLLLYEGNQEAKHHELKAEIRRREKALAEYATTRNEAFAKWLESGAMLTNVTGAVIDMDFETIEKNQVANAANAEAPGKLVEGPEQVAGEIGKALLFSGENSVDIEKVANFERTDPFTISLWMKVPEELDEIIVLHRCRAGSDAGNRGYELLLQDGKAVFALTHFWPGNAIKVATKEKLPLHQWQHVTVTYDGSSRAKGVRLFVNGMKAEIEIVRDQLFKTIGYEKEKMDVPLQLAARFRGRGFKDGLIDELKVFNRELTNVEVLSVFANQSLAETIHDISGAPYGKEAIRELFLARVDEGYQQQVAELRNLREEENTLVNSVPEIMVLGDLPEPRPSFILHRGEYHNHGEEVQPDVPAAVLPFNEKWPRNRIGLAKWLTSPENPLPARVTVNRYWQMFFGRGLVSTPEDFGSQGKLPTHPGLIDWLAKGFIDSAWNLKALNKQIVMSATYRQSSLASADKIKQDPHNQWLARGPSFRMSAEMLRDAVLAEAEMLERTIGGPSVMSHDQGGHKVKEQQKRKTDKPQEYRRTLYTYVKRTAPSPYLITFDATSREDCIAQRQRTNTPLQALVTLNDELFIEASQKLAIQMQEQGTLDRQIEFLFRRATGREPDAREREILHALYEEQLEIFRADGESAKKFLSSVVKWPQPVDDPAALAAAAVTANAVLNFDEAMTKR